jgi:putative SOS response-associated peptidase YedK
MCGRFTQTKSREEVLEELGGIELPPLFLGRYNIAPTQKVAVIRSDNPARAVESIWGFVNPRSGAPIINARSETLTERPMFQDLLPENRCLIPADGFYEWKGRQPYYFQLPDKALFAFAGLWRDGRCVIITRAADANMQGIHDRMPVILPRSHWNLWLECFHRAPVLSEAEGPTLTARPVSRRVNSVFHDDPECLLVGEVQTDLSLFPDDD